MTENNPANYTILDRINHGTFGIVYKIECCDTKDSYALKIIKKRIVDGQMNITDTCADNDFYNEIKLMIGQDTTFIVKIFDYWIDPDHFYIKMELCEGNLKSIKEIKYKAFERNKRNERMCILEFYLSCELFEEIAECLDYLHNKGTPIIHRDLKPANILLMKNNGRYLKLGDFGLSKFYIDSQTKTKGVGTSKYMAPEIHSGKYDTKADIYSFGVISTFLFDIDCFALDFNDISVHDDLKDKLGQLYNQLSDMTETKHRKRPNVATILDSMKLWRITAKDLIVKNGYCVKNEILKLQSFVDSFFYDFIMAKIKLEQSNEHSDHTIKKVIPSSNQKRTYKPHDNVDNDPPAIVKFAGLSINDGHMNEHFTIIPSTIVYGRCGSVTKAENKTNSKEYAIKRIIIRGYDDFKEKMHAINIWAQMDNEHYVKYSSHWVEKYDKNDQDKFLLRFIKAMELELNCISFYDFKREKNILDFALLHIQMEFCSLSLREGLNQMKSYFNFDNKQLLSDLAYYISCELLLEILEAIDYLHNYNPQLIHRNIKPDNILIKQISNGKFIKIGSFGIKFSHENPELYTDQRYIAPELKSGAEYDTKTDIYSIGVIIQELFNFDINFKPSGYISESYEKIIELTEKAMNGQRNARPDCIELIKTKSTWSIDYSRVMDQITANIDINRNYDLVKQFVQTFLRAKYDFHK